MAARYRRGQRLIWRTFYRDYWVTVREVIAEPGTLWAEDGRTALGEVQDYWVGEPGNTGQMLAHEPDLRKPTRQQETQYTFTKDVYPDWRPRTDKTWQLRVAPGDTPITFATKAEMEAYRDQTEATREETP